MLGFLLCLRAWHGDTHILAPLQTVHYFHRISLLWRALMVLPFPPTSTTYLFVYAAATTFIAPPNAEPLTPLAGHLVPTVYTVQ